HTYTPPMSISYADIIAAEPCLSAAEAAALAVAALDAAQQHGLAAPPSSDRIWLDAAGAVSITGDSEDRLTGDPVIATAALVSLLLGLDRNDEAARPHIPGPLLLALSRVRGQIDLPPVSVTDLRRVLERIGTSDHASLA